MILTPQEMLQQYNEAVATGICVDLYDNADCDSLCDGCPAQPSCNQLSYNHEKETSDYAVFVTNYVAQIKPLLPIKE